MTTAAARRTCARAFIFRSAGCQGATLPCAARAATWRASHAPHTAAMCTAPHHTLAAHSIAPPAVRARAHGGVSFFLAIAAHAFKPRPERATGSHHAPQKCCVCNVPVVRATKTRRNRTCDIIVCFKASVLVRASGLARRSGAAAERNATRRLELCFEVPCIGAFRAHSAFETPLRRRALWVVRRPSKAECHAARSTTKRR